MDYLADSHFWFATVQEVLHADWQELWHLPQPPFTAEAFRLALLMVVMCFKSDTSFVKYYRSCLLSNTSISYPGGFFK